MAQLKIGELADRARCQVETIRYYEKEGLLPPPQRSEGNYRLYNDAHADRLAFIRHCRSLDMTLDEIRALLALRDHPLASCEQVNTLLDQHISHVVERIAELKSLEKQLRKLRCLCNQAQTTEQCGILNELEKESPAALAPSCSKPHVGEVHAKLRK